MTKEDSLKYSNIFQAKKNGTINVGKSCGNKRKKQSTPIWQNYKVCVGNEKKEEKVKQDR